MKTAYVTPACRIAEWTLNGQLGYVLRRAGAIAPEEMGRVIQAEIDRIAIVLRKRGLA